MFVKSYVLCSVSLDDILCVFCCDRYYFQMSATTSCRCQQSCLWAADQGEIGLADSGPVLRQPAHSPLTTRLNIYDTYIVIRNSTLLSSRFPLHPLGSRPSCAIEQSLRVDQFIKQQHTDGVHHRDTERGRDSVGTD